MSMIEPVATDDATLVAQAAGGSEHAFRALYRSYVRPVYWLAHGLVGNASDAEDVTQETFLVAWRKIPGLQLQGESLLPWLVTICRFQAANRMRAQRRERENTTPVEDGELASLPAAVDVERQLIDAELTECIVRAVAGLTPLDREIFRLCASEGYTYEAAAAELGVEHGAVRNRLSRIRTRLRTVVKEST
jgi:RNA polymerase sigma factor (sigma-70 family)